MIVSRSHTHPPWVLGFRCPAHPLPGGDSRGGSKLLAALGGSKRRTCRVRNGRTYRGYSKLRPRTFLGSYRRPMPRSIGPPYDQCGALISSNPCTFLRLLPFRGDSKLRIRPPWYWGYRGTSLLKERLPLGPYSRPVPMVLRRSQEGGVSFKVQGSEFRV